MKLNLGLDLSRKTWGTSEVIERLVLTQSGSLRAGETATFTGSKPILFFAASVDGVPQVLTKVSDTVWSVALDRAGALSVSAVSDIGIATSDFEIIPPIPRLTASYSVGTGDPVLVTVNTTGTLKWLISTQPVVASIPDPTGSAFVGSGSLGLELPSVETLDVDQYLHLSFEGSPVVSLLFLLKEEESAGELALYTFNGGLPPGLSVQRASIGDRITPANSYRFAGENTARIHWEDAVQARLLLAPTATTAGRTPAGGVTLRNGATSVDTATPTRMSVFNQYLKTINLPIAYTDQLTAGPLAVPFTEAGETFPFCIELSIQWSDPTAPLWLDIGNTGTSTAKDGTTVTDGVLVKFNMQDLSFVLSVPPLVDGVSYRYGQTPVVQIAKGIDDYYTIRVIGLLQRATVGTNYLFPKMLSPKVGVVFGFDYMARYVLPKVASLDVGAPLVDTVISMGAGDTGVTATSALRATRSGETLRVTEVLGTVDIRIKHLFGQLDLTNQDLDGDWSYTPTDPLQISSIGVYTVGGLPQ